MLISLSGLPYIDVRVSFNSFVPNSLDSELSEKLVNYYIDQLVSNPNNHDKVEFEILHSCYTLDLPERLSEQKAHGFSQSECEEISESLRILTNNIINDKDGLWKKDSLKIEELKKRHAVIQGSDLSKIERIYWLIEDCKRYGTLPFAGPTTAEVHHLGLASDLDDSGDPEKVAKVVNLLKNEIRQNRLRGLNYLKDMHEQYPEVTVGIETKDAIRSVLNHERASIKKLRKNGMLESDETERMVTAVEERMKNVMESSLELRLPEPEEVLREVTWVKGLPDSVISQLVNVSEQRTYNSGDRIMEQGGEGDGMIVITKGSVQVAIGDLVVDILGRGAVIGEMSVLAGVPRTANVLHFRQEKRISGTAKLCQTKSKEVDIFRQMQGGA